MHDDILNAKKTEQKYILGAILQQAKFLVYFCHGQINSKCEDKYLLLSCGTNKNGIAGRRMRTSRADTCSSQGNMFVMKPVIKTNNLPIGTSLGQKTDPCWGCKL